ncbi:MAG: peroxiredoxin family protein [Myxococcales bacterium]|nr:peroxiredoxin family protein [Myxococcales bacterium]
MADSQAELERHGATIVAISVDSKEDSLTLAGKLAIRFPLLADPGLKTALAYGVAMDGEEIAVPSVFVISKDKRIRFKQVGESVVDRPSVGDILDEVDKARELSSKAVSTR